MTSTCLEVLRAHAWLHRVFLRKPSLPVSPDCHALLTIRNLTRNRQVSTSHMRIITIQRTVPRTKRAGTTRHRIFLQFARDFFAGENHLHFAIEALLFGVLLALCAWPIVAAAGAISQVL